MLDFCHFLLPGACLGEGLGGAVLPGLEGLRSPGSVFFFIFGNSFERSATWALSNGL